MKPFILILGIVLSLCVNARADVPFAVSFFHPDPDQIEVYRDLPYAGTTRKTQTLDIYLPKGSYRPSPQPLPLVVYIHGGAWHKFNKNLPFALGVVEKGYAVASINYRLSGEAVYPAQYEDCESAILWLQTHAAEYGINPHQIAAWGLSSGGHLASMLGVKGKVQAVCDWYGPVDLTHPDEDEANLLDPGCETKLLGGDFKNLGRQASPVNFITKNTCPFFIIHGARDPCIPLSQSQGFYEKLKQAGVDVTFIIVPNEGHGFKTASAAESTIQFLDQHFKK